MNKNSYNKIVEQWQEVRDTAEINTPILEFAKKLPHHSQVLDIGCGTGKPIAAFLASKEFYVTGIDVAEKMIEKALEFHLDNSEFINIDFQHFETPKKFDGIIAWDSLFHLPKEAQLDVYDKIADLLKPNGYFMFTHGTIDSEHTNPMFGENFYYSSLEKNKVLQLIHKAGMELIKTWENFKEGKDERDWIVLARKAL